MLHKLRTAMSPAEPARLTGLVEVDQALYGGVALGMARQLAGG